MNCADDPSGAPEDPKRPNQMDMSSLRGSINSVDRYNTNMDQGHMDQAFAMKEVPGDPFVIKWPPSVLLQTSSETSRQLARPSSQTFQRNS